jgi:hypothetical protein
MPHYKIFARGKRRKISYGRQILRLALAKEIKLGNFSEGYKNRKVSEKVPGQM